MRMDLWFRLRREGEDQAFEDKSLVWRRRADFEVGAGYQAEGSG